jgi:hypothetical protein
MKWAGTALVVKAWAEPTRPAFCRFRPTGTFTGDRFRVVAGAGKPLRA